MRKVEPYRTYLLLSLYLPLLTGNITHATELMSERPGFFWPRYHRLDNSSSHVAD